MSTPCLSKARAPWPSSRRASRPAARCRCAYRRCRTKARYAPPIGTPAPGLVPASRTPFERAPRGESPARACRRNQQVRVHERLAARQIHDIEVTAVIVHQMVEHPAELLAAHVERVVVLVVHVADRAIEIASARDRHDGQPHLLRVTLARPAVERTAVLDLSLHLRRPSVHGRWRASACTTRRPSKAAPPAGRAVHTVCIHTSPSRSQRRARAPPLCRPCTGSSSREEAALRGAWCARIGEEEAVAQSPFSRVVPRRMVVSRNEEVIAAAGLGKQFGETVALDDVRSIEGPGLVAVLGPNGAGGADSCSTSWKASPRRPRAESGSSARARARTREGASAS